MTPGSRPMFALGFVLAVAAILLVAASELDRRDLEQRVADLESGSSRSDGAAPPTDGAPPSPSSGTRKSPASVVDAPASAPALTDAEVQAAWEAEFRLEDVDDEWAPRTTERLGDAIRAHITPRSRLQSIECRRSYCRVEISHPDIVTHNELMADLFLINRRGPLARETGGFRTMDGVPANDGRLRYVIFVARKGVSLVSPQPFAKAPSAP